MRFSFHSYLPYLMMVMLLFLPQSVEKRLSQVIQNLKLTVSSSSKEHAQHPCVQQEKPMREDEAFFHQSLDGFSSWILANIISHKEAPWSHTAWIDVGSETKGLLFPIVPNCPVVYGKHVVGVVEQVGKKASLIRVLSDPLVRPSVQVVRGGKDQKLEELIGVLLAKIESTPSVLAKESHTLALQKLLQEMLVSLPEEQRLFLAKGELQGSLSLKRPQWLRGVGFNYDISDEHGPSRDIRTGQVDGKGPKVLLLQPGDLLVTNGLDGLFPEGLTVAWVKKVLPLEEGGFSYEIEAIASCPVFLNLRRVAIIPAVPEEVHEESIELSTLLRQVEQAMDGGRI